MFIIIGTGKQFEIKNLTEGGGRRVLAVIEYKLKKGKIHVNSKLVFIPSLKSKKVSISYRIENKGAGKLCLSLKDPENKKVYLMKTKYVEILRKITN